MCLRCLCGDIQFGALRWLLLGFIRMEFVLLLLRQQTSWALLLWTTAERKTDLPLAGSWSQHRWRVRFLATHFSPFGKESALLLAGMVWCEDSGRQA